MARLMQAFVLNLGIAVAVLGGCNAVLGIEEAQLREGEGSGGSASGGPSDSPNATPQLEIACTAPDTACTACLAKNCIDEKVRCLADSSCRFGLKSFRVCLGSQCSDTSGTCLNKLTTLEDSLYPGDLTLAACASIECSAECANMPLVGPCDLYCGCMAPVCAGELAAQPHSALGAECMTECEKQTPGDINCRWTHCEVAIDRPDEGHCGHAIGQANCNPNVSVVNTCRDKSQTSFACKVGADCCSGKCTRNVCE